MSEPVSELVHSTIVNRSTETRFRRCWRFLRRSSARLIWGLVAIGLLLRFTIRDQFHPWALIYYLTPIPALAVWLFLASWAWGRNSSVKTSRKRFSPARLSLSAGLAFVVWTLCSDYVDRADSPLPDDLRLVFWNTARVELGVNRLATQLRIWDSPVIGLVEANGFYPEFVEQWQCELPEYKIAATHFGGLIAVKGTVKAQISHQLSPTSWCDQFDLTIGDNEITVLLVDISAQLNLSRRQPLLDLAVLAEKLADRPLIIMGDFNTPDDSALLGPLHTHCQQAFRERGAGYAPTWPMPLPVLTLDQVWVSRHVTVSRCEHRWSVYSDHRPVITSVSFRR